MQAIEQHGLVAWLWLALRRVGRCHPFGRPGSIPCRRAAAAGAEATHGKARLSRDLSVVRRAGGLPGDDAAPRRRSRRRRPRPRRRPRHRAPRRRRPGATSPTPVDSGAHRCRSSGGLRSSATTARDIVVETEAVRAVFNTAGATLKSWQLKQTTRNVTSRSSSSRRTCRRRSRAPFTISTDDQALSRTLATAIYKPSAEPAVARPARRHADVPATATPARRSTREDVLLPARRPGVHADVEASVDVGGASQPVVVHLGPAIGAGYRSDGDTCYPRAILPARRQRRAAQRPQTSAPQPTYQGDDPSSPASRITTS